MAKPIPHHHNHLQLGISKKQLEEHLFRDHKFEKALRGYSFEVLVEGHNARHPRGVAPPYYEVVE